MPELPEVETIKAAIAKGIGCCKIEQVTVRNRRLREPVPQELEDVCVGAGICGYRRIGKYIVMDLDNASSLILHLGMSGRITICDKLPAELGKHDHIIFKTSNGYIIYNDARRFGLCCVAETNKLGEFKFFRKRGIDPFSEDLTVEYLQKQFAKRSKLVMKQALLMQDIIDGIGNIYASEILYQARISPLRTVGSLSAKEIDELIKQTRAVLNKAILAGGSTLRDYQKPDGSLGYFQNMHCVYNKTGQRCPDCKCNIEKTGGIKRIVQNGRSTFYCERLQK